MTNFAQAVSHSINFTAAVIPRECSAVARVLFNISRDYFNGGNNDCELIAKLFTLFLYAYTIGNAEHEEGNGDIVLRNFHSCREICIQGYTVSLDLSPSTRSGVIDARVEGWAVSMFQIAR